MKFLKILTFILAFTIEIRVHAELVQVPEQCAEKKQYCVLKALNTKEIYKGDDYLISMQSNTTLIRQKENLFSFVKGMFFIKADRDMSLETPYGKVDFKSGTQAILEKMNGRVEIQTIFGQVLVKPIGNKKPVYIFEGYENCISEVDQSAQAQMGIPKPILVEPLLKNWSALSGETKEDFLQDVDRFKSIHEKAVKDLSILNDQIVQREIASVQAAKRAQKEREEQEKAAQKARQDMYYQRLLGE